MKMSAHCRLTKIQIFGYALKYLILSRDCKTLLLKTNGEKKKSKKSENAERLRGRHLRMKEIYSMKSRGIHNFHFGILRKEYLKTEYPMQYQILLMTGELPAHLMKIEQAAQILKRRLTTKMLSGNSSSNYLKNLRDNRTAEMEIERIILEEIVYQPLETTD